MNSWEPSAGRLRWESRRRCSIRSASPAALAKAAERAGSAAEVAGDEAFWLEIQQAFTVDRSVINLNNAGVSPAPAVVQAAQKRHLDFSNSMPPPVALWEVQDPQRETVRQRLARTFGTGAEEIALVRNSSEGLQICQLGFDLQRGDEVLTTNQDYPRMIAAFEQRARREGIVLKQFSLPGARRGRRRGRRPVPAQHHFKDEAHPGVPHDQPHGADPAREAGRRAGARAGHPGDRGRRAVVRPRPISIMRTWVATTSRPACTSGCSPPTAPACCT